MKILIVEDNSEINYMIKEYLHKQNIECISAFSTSEAEYNLRNFVDIDLIILDIMLPYENGDKLLERIKQKYDIPVIILSAKDEIDTKIAMLDLGADDYICKPFELEELYARMKVQLRKKQQSKMIENGDLKIICNQRRVSVGDKEIKLTRYEYSIIELLMSNPDRVFTKAEIYEYVWHQEYQNDDKVVNTHISNLRRKLQNVDSEHEYIETVWGIGFKMGKNINGVCN